jgi:epoxyqueuosine reductase QueG
MDRQIEIVEWIDPHSIDDWTDVDRIETKPSLIISVGQVLKETKEVIVIGLNYNPENKDASCSMIIP